MYDCLVKYCLFRANGTSNAINCDHAITCPNRLSFSTSSVSYYTTDSTVSLTSQCSHGGIFYDDAFDEQDETTSTSHQEHNGTLTLQIPIELHRRLAEAAQRNGVSLNQYILFKLSQQEG